jgi:hypothetical protein
MLLAALTVGVGLWSLQTTTRAQLVSAAVRATPDVPTVHVSHARASTQDFQAGVSVVVYGNDRYFEQKAKVLLNRLADLGANSVSFVVPIFQNGTLASEVRADSQRTPSDVKIAAFVTEARRRGFTVMLRPLLDIGTPETPTDWRGTIRPQDLAHWHQTYTDLLMTYARLARVNHVDVLNIGSELDSMERDTGYWQGLISSARSVYPGQLTYSSNWAKGYPAFGRSLDFISVDAYFPLNRTTAASAADLATAWQPWIDRLTRMRRSFAKPLVLTEMGATSLVGSFQQPWIWDNGQPLDLTAQQRYYQAACESVVPRFGGVYWWMYALDPPAKPALDRSYAVAGKPAEADLRDCFVSAPWTHL